MENKKGQLSGILASFVIVAAAIIMLVLMMYVFSSLSTSFDSTRTSVSAVNETTGGINQTGYLVSTASNTSNANFVLVSAYDVNGTGTKSFITSNVTLSSTGLLQNSTTLTYGTNATVSYTYGAASPEIEAGSTSITSISNAVPLVGIIFVVVAIGAIIGILIGAFVFRKNRA